ncbi:MAG TPA: ATP-binding protein [Candidatus Binatia bacterium]
MKLGKTTIAFPLSDAALTTRFAVHSLICIAIMTVALWFIVSQYMISEMMDREWETAGQILRSEVKEFLVPEDFKTPDRKSVGYKFEQLLKHMTAIPDLVRFRVYSPQTVVLWSDDKRLVGQKFSDDNELREAIGQARIVADLSSLRRSEDVLERGELERTVEIYVPIFSDNPRELLAVFDLYKRADSIYRHIHKARLVVLIGALGGGLLLYLSLIFIVRQAEKKISEQQQALMKIQSELIGSQRMAAVGEMAAAVAHGIGNPLSSIRAAAQVAKLDCKECCSLSLRDKTRGTLESIMQQVDRVQKRMQGLLNIAKPMEPRFGPVEVNTLLEGIVGVLKPRFAEAQVTPELELGSNLSPAELDANQVEQVFMGLITNALEATPPGGRVTIRTRSTPSNGNPAAINISVEDTGGGIPAENRERIFEPFFTTKTQGTGIGLPLARKFVERNGGTIEVGESSGGSGGARFDVTFPTGAKN